MSGFFGIESFTPPWDVFFLPLFNLLIGIYELPFADFAIAIIVFTIVIRTLLAPLFVRQIRSQKEMQRMQPLIREVQRKHKGNRQKISEETMALYKEHGVNPAAGCLPVLLQLPILFALYQALIRASGVVTGFNPSGTDLEIFTSLREKIDIVALRAGEYRAPISGPCDLPEFSRLPQFLPLNCQLIDPIKLTEPVQTTVSWLLNLDLARVDHVFALEIFGFPLSALAVIAAVLQFVQVKMTSPRTTPGVDDPTASMTSTMTYTFPLLTIFWGGLFPSGLILYWIVYTGYLVVHQFLIMGWGNLFPLFGWQPRFAPSAEPALISEPPRRQPTARQSERPRTEAVSRPPTTPPDAAAVRASQPANRRSGRQKRRGRRR